MKKDSKNTDKTKAINYEPLLGKVFYDEIVKLFTSTDTYREWMIEPFIIDDYVYATDGHALIKVPKKCVINDYEPIKESIRESIARIMPDKKQLKYTIKIAELKEAITSIPKIEEFRNVESDYTCKECEGNGEVEWEYEGYTDYFDCPVCNGDKKLSKNHVIKTGRKIYDKNHFIDIKKSRFKEKYLSKIVAIANYIKSDSIILLSQKEPNSMSLFSMNDIEILIMPINQTDEQSVAKHFA